MSILTVISRLAHTYRDRRRLSRNERMIGALPPEVRKDIGWPDRSATWGERLSRAETRRRG